MRFVIGTPGASGIACGIGALEILSQQSGIETHPVLLR